MIVQMNWKSQTKKSITHNDGISGPDGRNNFSSKMFIGILSEVVLNQIREEAVIKSRYI